MRKIFLAISFIGLVSLTSCGSQENCRGRASNDKIINQQPNQMMVAVDKNDIK